MRAEAVEATSGYLNLVPRELEEVMAMNIDRIELKLAEADAVIGAAKMAIVERLAAKGVTATVSFSADYSDRIAFSVSAHGSSPFPGYTGLTTYAGGYGKNLSEAFRKLIAEIEMVEDVRPYADDFAAPLFLMSEQHVGAAE